MDSLEVRKCGTAAGRNCRRTRERSNFGLLAGLLLAMVMLAGPLFAAKQYTAPRAYDARTYPARDEHPNEKIIIAADPYDVPDKASIFVLPYDERGYLPVYLVITNDGDAPINLADMKAQFVTVDRSKIQPATDDDLYRRFSQLKHRGDEPSRNPLPLPLPRKAEAGVGKAGAEEIRNAPFRAKAVEPHSTQAGFLFFDVQNTSHPLAGAHLYVTGVRDSEGAELMFFDIPMEKYLTYRPVTK